MLEYRWFLRPVSIFIFSLIALGASLFIYIRSFLNVNEAFRQFLITHNFDVNKFAQTETWVTILTLSILVAVILVGLFLLVITYQRAMELYRMQQNFISGFTHELKTPIASIRLYLDTFLKHDLAPDKQKQYLEYMLEDTDRLSSNVEQILSLGRLEDKNYTAKFEKVDAKEMILNLVSELQHRHQNGIIQVDEDSFNNFWIKVDQQLFQVLLTNIISNGIYHNLSKQPKVSIRAELDREGLNFVVKDNGVGIDQKFEKKVFKKFFQIGKSAKGSGLGLYMSQIITKLHGGKISVKGLGEGKGSVFRIVLPKNRVGSDKAK